jgi:PAS domain S-box-containing protein
MNGVKKLMVADLIPIDSRKNQIYLMLDEIINNPGLTRYLTRFKPEQIIFLEGDDSQELYILVSGQVAILKGDIKIRELARKGTIFGEMSFFLGSTRTASIRAKNDVTVLRIPKEEITVFLAEFPDAAREITRHLAQWLAETSQILYGLKEFCDQMPDAVILTDRDGRILTWNSTAEKLYGRSWEQMHNANTAEIYVEPQGYQQFLQEVQNHYSVKENIFKISHPQKGTRFISTSMTVLYDGHHNFQGVLSLGRDVTGTKNLEKKYKRIGYWLAGALLLLSLATAAVFWGYPYVAKDYQNRILKQKLMQDYLAKDFFVLKSLLGEPIAGGNRLKTKTIMKNFLLFQQKTTRIYTGLVLLDEQRIVVEASSLEPEADINAMIGSSYADIEFTGSETSLHRVLIVYRADKNHSMGKQSVEIAYELKQNEESIGWLIFQMDMDQVKKNLDLDLADLTKLQIEKP